jgi:transcriptional regulator with XRE-family HTH domain
MDGRRFAREFRALRLHRRLRQADVAAAARLSRAAIERLETGSLRGMRLGTIVDAADGLGAEVDLRLRWRGEHLDRLLDAAHSRLVERLASLLRAASWEVALEATYSIFGERGSIDVLAFHPPSGALLSSEVKSTIPDAQLMLASLDRKARLAPRLAADRGWESRTLGVLLVVAEGSSARRRVSALETSFGAAFPTRGRAVRRWIATPAAPMRGLLFLPLDRPGVIGASQRVGRRVRRPTSGPDLSSRSPLSAHGEKS